MSILEWTINTSEEYSMFYQPLEIYCTQVGWSTERMEVLIVYPEFPGAELIFCHVSLFNKGGSL